MNIRSLGLRTDLFFLRHQGEVIEREGYLVARSPGEPGYHWGNLLVFPEAPRPGDRARWLELFAREFPPDSGVRHMTFAWDDPTGAPGAAGEFLAEGFHFDPCDVLVAEEVLPPPRPNAAAELRPLEGDGEWARAAETAVLCRDPRYAEDSYRTFAERRMTAQRQLVEAGHGAWWGAFRGGELVADMGVFLDGEVARYQSVQTHPDHRRQGLCGTLLHRAAAWASEERGARVFVIEAEPEGDAGRVYRAAGFLPRELLAGLSRAPRAMG
jgi:RimJ/RimL family protein N-acetyltransferase